MTKNYSTISDAPGLLNIGQLTELIWGEKIVPTIKGH